MQLDHVCIAVRSIDQAVPRLCAMFGYAPRTATVHNTRQQVNVRFLCKPGSLDLKLIEPDGETSPLWGFLRKGEGLHHLCFKVPELASGLAECQGQGLRVIAAPAPGEAFDDQLIAFGYAGLGLNVELIDTDRRRNQVDSSDPDHTDLAG